MTATTEPSATRKRSKSQSNLERPAARGIIAKSIPMSKTSQSAELDEYTESMRHFLATLEQSNANQTHAGRCRNRSGTQSHSSGSDSNSGSSSGREKSPEFQWMDLASLRRKHDSTNFEDGLIGNGSCVTKGPARLSGRHHHHRHCISKDTARHHHHRECRTADPTGKAHLSKKHAAHAAKTKASSQARAISCPSSEKNYE
ncbi:hypothetical protein A1O3_03360 [Capronia epimyces CBS 606.96]|uniref:Uncharacterized protein n=1 Tax=Capronia epimyces CBS 606.96 TaxID=1182542 RepID=W9YVW1_9EURO|nr:uncharacterized protein A1O3_03360 [Capronia epimyces CBS 606.96]EXJ86409.1 hypothetical protein A1O3_03360 [Capronia epimyces CBS 606.96]